MDPLTDHLKYLRNTFKKLIDKAGVDYPEKERKIQDDAYRYTQMISKARMKGDENMEESFLKLAVAHFEKTYPIKGKIGDGLLSAPLRAIDAINKAGRRGTYPPSMRAAIEKYGNNKIVKLTVGRNPIISAIQKVANLLVGDKLKKLNIDTLFHLFLIIELDNGQKFKTERNQVLNFTSSIGEVKESIEVPINKDITLAEFFDNTLKKVGNILFVYNAVSNNCQMYIMQLLTSNGLINDSIKNFVKQDTNTLLSPFLSKAANVVTDTAATIDKLLYGSGMRGYGKEVKLNF